MNDNGDFIYEYTQKMITQVVSNQDKATLKAIERYCEENNIIPNIIEKEKLDLILKLGIAEYDKRFGVIINELEGEDK